MSGELDVISSVPRVSEFYSGRTLFVTGFSGFIGRCVVEKLLWTCPDIDRVYVLMRGRKNMTAEQRTTRVLDSDCFSRLRERDPSFRTKIVTVIGDALLPHLGISPQDRERIVSEVSIIVHSAATVRFDEPLTISMDINILGTKSLLELALTMPHLEVFSHISTAYTNCNRSYVDEKMYPPLADWKETIFIKDKIDPYILNTLTYKIKGRTPNTYTFTKNIAEHMVYDYGDRIPINILRPSIVSAAVEEPLPGWFQSIDGPGGAALGYSTGFLRVLYTKRDAKMDFVPCDIISKAIAFTTCLRSFQRQNVKPIYHLTSKDMSLNVYECLDQGLRACRKKPLKYALWKNNLTFTHSYAYFYFLMVFCQLVPAILIDLLLRLFGQTPFMMKLEKKMNDYIKVYMYFFRHNFIFDNKNSYRAEKFMRDEDKAEMHYAIKLGEINIPKLLINNIAYIGKKYFNQKPEDDVNAARLSAGLTVLDAGLKYGFIGYLVYYIYSRAIIPHLLTTTYNFLFDFC